MLIEQCYNGGYGQNLIRLTNGGSILSRAQQLYQLQHIDTQLDEAKTYLKRIAANLGKNKALLAAEASAEAANTQQQQAQKKMRQLEQDVKKIATKISSQEKKLYGGKVLSAKEASNLQDEVTALKRRHTQLEENLLEAMLAFEEAEEEANQAQAALAETEQTWQSEQDKLTMLQTQFKEKVEKLIKQRPTIAQTIKAEDIAEYTKLRKSRAGKAVSQVINGLCQGCNVSISNSKQRQARSSSELVYCSTCRRILYVI